MRWAQSGIWYVFSTVTIPGSMTAMYCVAPVDAAQAVAPAAPLQVGTGTRKRCSLWSHTGASVVPFASGNRSEEHTSELQSLAYLVCRLLLEKKKKKYTSPFVHSNLIT